jgi:hypothetical protein
MFKIKKLIYTKTEEEGESLEDGESPSIFVL